MQSTINSGVLQQIVSHQRRLGVKYWLKGLGYERCAELPWIVDHLAGRFHEELKFLDIGTGESPLPTFLRSRTSWDITCVDKCSWVQQQYRFLKTLNGTPTSSNSFRVIEEDLLAVDLPPHSFDIITSVSVIEHFEGTSDSEAMKATARLLRPGGHLILTTLINEPYFAEFYVEKTVYGVKYNGSPTFYQRHYDRKGILERLIEPSGLVEKQRVYFGDYDFQCFEKVLQRPLPLRVLNLFSKPKLAETYLSYRPYPVSRKEMRMNTASGVILVLEKPMVTSRSEDSQIGDAPRQ